MIVLLPPDPQLYSTPLARLLHQDMSGTMLADYRQSFQAGSLAAKKKLHEPLSHEDFEINQAIADSTALAAEVITSVWEAMHE